MGVAGAGKTLIGEQLARSLAVKFFDADDFHSPEAVAKMASGTPLTDADRGPWLDRIASRISETDSHGESAVFACSTLKESYREKLRSAAAAGHVKFVFLRVTPELASSRLKKRRGHYMPPGLVASQFSALEEPSNVLALDGSRRADDLVREILKRLPAKESADDHTHQR